MIFSLQIETLLKEYSAWQAQGVSGPQSVWALAPFRRNLFFSPESLTSPFLTPSSPYTHFFSHPNVPFFLEAWPVQGSW
jgi:hypothetical protein